MACFFFSYCLGELPSIHGCIKECTFKMHQISWQKHNTLIFTRLHVVLEIGMRGIRLWNSYITLRYVWDSSCHTVIDSGGLWCLCPGQSSQTLLFNHISDTILLIITLLHNDGSKNKYFKSSVAVGILIPHPSYYSEPKNFDLIKMCVIEM